LVIDVPVLTKVGLALGEGQYIAHDGTVVKLRVQHLGPGVSHYVATVNNKAHVVLPVPASEDVAEGMKYEDLIWNLVTLLLQRGVTDERNLASFVMEMKSENAFLKDELRKLSDKEESSLRTARLEIEELLTALNYAKMEFRAKTDAMEAKLSEYGARNDAMEAENAALKKEVSSLKLEMATTMDLVKAQMMEMMVQLSQQQQQQVMMTMMEMPKMVGKEEAEKWLVEKGVKKDKNDKWDKEAAFEAARWGNLEVLKWLHTVNMSDAKEKDKCELNVAHSAAEKGHLEVLKWLHTVNMLDAKEKNSDGWNVAHCAAIVGHLEVLKWLHTVNMLDAKEKTKIGRNVAHCAAWEKYWSGCTL